MIVRYLFVSCIFIGWAFSASAGESDLPLVPSPSVKDFTRGEGWGIALGLGVEYESAYDGSDEYEFELDPAGAIQWRTDNHLFFWEGIELGWRAKMFDNWLLQVAARYESGREADDSNDGRLDGLEDQDDEFAGVLEVRWSLDSDWRNWIAGRVMAGDSDLGLLGVAAIGHRFGNHRNGSGTELFLFATFGDDNFLNRDFGVSTRESVTSGLPETDLNGGYRSSGLTIIDRRDLTNKVHLICEAGFEYYSSDIQDSPIARKDYEAEVGMTILYQF
ncbi:MAG: MipA/OmpV family protein [Deltaproteobacteria bacterium]|jgi:outer membrane scaffolding protein for murein synthesis (MipA/OmpV family)|nr:MipA/OmpV family protein [Deltaproteobacteria bacterium]